MFWVAAAAVAQFVAPQPREMWFRKHDTPEKYLSKRPMALVWLRLTIRPDGTLRSCEIEESSGEPGLDSYTCDLTRSRAQFRPARLADGTQTYGVYRVPILWSLEPAFPDPEGDLMLTVNALPRGVRSPQFLRLALAVDAAGHIGECASQPPPFRDAPPNNTKLVSIACAQLLKDYTATPALDDDGKPVASIQIASVVFSKPK
jgi:TonB family protein